MRRADRRAWTPSWTRPAAGERLCRGTLLSRAQYLLDVERWGYRDARLQPSGTMTAEEIELWTARIEEERRPGHGGGRRQRRKSTRSVMTPVTPRAAQRRCSSGVFTP